MIDTRLYGVWEKLLLGEQMEIVCEDLDYCTATDLRIGLQNLVTDNIEKEIIHKKVHLIFRDYNKHCYLTLPDMIVNLCLWGLVLQPGHTLKPCHIFFCKNGINKKEIANYINKYCIVPNRDTMESSTLNETIYNNHKLLKYAERFAMYYNNSINYEDFILMADACPEFNDLIHKDYSELPADTMNSEAMKDCNRLIELILESKKWIGRDHCLADAFRAKVGVKPKQFREMVSVIGIKPNGEGGIYPYSIDASYMRGGLNRFEWMVAEAGIGRQAQILSKQNTADSGAFARVLGLNQLDTTLYINRESLEVDPTYDCHTKNFVEVDITEQNIEMYQDRYYRIDPNGFDLKTGCAGTLNRDLIGKRIYLRSPITCASAAKGLGICRKCYGDLFMVNKDINIGKIAAELISQTLTQLMLSAKHLLEAKISKIEWAFEDFDTYFIFDDETVNINSEYTFNKKWTIYIDREGINVETVVGMSDDGDGDGDELDILKEYVTEFTLISDTGEAYLVSAKNSEPLYITQELSKLINSKNYEDENDIYISVMELLNLNCPLFYVGIYNDDLGKNLKEVMSIINLKSRTCEYDRHTMLKDFTNKLIDCGMGDIRSVHAEIIIMNQIRSVDDILENPDWDYPDAPYRILTLRQALEANRSVLISMQYEHLSRVLYKPISFRKTAPSCIDLFHHVQPQVYTSQEVKEEKRVPLFTKIVDKKD